MGLFWGKKVIAKNEFDWMAPVVPPRNDAKRRER